MSKIKLFLDDIRNPNDCASYMHNRIGKLNPIYLEGGWLIVRNFDQFVDAIKEFHHHITHISYDHDLADTHYIDDMYSTEDEYYKSIEGTEKTGLDCAKFMKEFYESNELEWPVMFVHSMNPVGTQAIINIFK